MSIHNIIIKDRMNAEDFAFASSACKKLSETERFSSIVTGWDGFGSGYFTKKQISFNGKDTGESFVLCLSDFNTKIECNTYDEPYDTFVCCCMMILKYYLPNIIIASSCVNDEIWTDF